MQDPQSENFLHVSDITLHVEPRFKKTIDRVVFKSGSVKKPFGEAHVRVAPGSEHKHEFKPAHTLPSREKLSVVVKYPIFWLFHGKSAVHVAVNEIITDAKDRMSGGRVYSKMGKNIRVEIGISSSQSTIDTRTHNSDPASGPASPPTSANADPKNATLLQPQPFPVEPAAGTLLETHIQPNVGSTETLPPPTLDPTNTDPVGGPASPPTSKNADPENETLPQPQPFPVEPAAGTLPETHIQPNADPTKTLPLSTLDPTNADSASGAHPPLTPTTKEILKKCPRFRLLIIGNTGVGKTSLVQKVFGVKEVHIADNERGEADINKEYIATENELFVVHDSLGFEAGESANFGKVKDFIRERQAKPELKDRLHAIWVCITVPYADGRLLEAGIEDLLKKRKSLLRNIPVVIVLTKVDLLDARLLQEMGRRFNSMEEAMRAVEPDRANFLETNCVAPLKKVVEGYIPHVTVSTKSTSYKYTLPELVKTTISEIEEYIKSEEPISVPKPEQQLLEHVGPSVVAGMAQRVNFDEKVRLTIEVGQERYWKKLASNSIFSGQSIKDSLLILHQDIIQVWNFNDPEGSLHDEKFQERLLDAPDIVVKAGVRPSGWGLMQQNPGVNALVHDPVGTAVTFIITGTLSLAKRGQEAYNSGHVESVKRFMAYIVDLVYVMKILFFRAREGSITPQDVSDAHENYKERHRKQIHERISDFELDPEIEQDTVLEEILKLIGEIDVSHEERTT